MAILKSLSPKTKTAAATAAGSFFVANPLISLFAIGAGVAVYFAWRSRRA
jgi:hypothetical protein